MTIRSIEELIANLDVAFPDNNVQAITPDVLRQYMTDLVQTFAPYKALMQMTTPVVKALTTTPVVLGPYQTIMIESLPFLDANVAGTIARAISGATKVTTGFVIEGNISGSGGIDVEVRLFKNGVATPFFQMVSASSGTNNEPYSFVALDIANANATYDVRVSVPSGSSSITFNSTTFFAQAIPAITFT